MEDPIDQIQAAEDVTDLITIVIKAARNAERYLTKGTRTYISQEQVDEHLALIEMAAVSRATYLQWGSV
jgi:hypothetical protein